MEMLQAHLFLGDIQLVSRQARTESPAPGNDLSDQENSVRGFDSSSTAVH